MLAKRVKWGLSASVVALLLIDGFDVKVSYLKRSLSRATALKHERREIERLLARGYVLANSQHNPSRPKVAEEVVSALRAQLSGQRPTRVPQSKSRRSGA